MNKKTLMYITTIIAVLTMTSSILKNVLNIKYNGLNSSYIYSIIFAIIILIFYLIETKERANKRKKRNQIKALNNDINNIQQEIEKQDNYLNKQIVTRQYREQKAKKDGK